jgi:hypothetical protein
VSQVEQHLLILPEDLSSPKVFSGVRVARSLFFCVMICRSLFVLFLWAIALSVLLITPLDIGFRIMFYKRKIKTSFDGHIEELLRRNRE